jgi:uncharacterized protein YhaN
LETDVSCGTEGYCFVIEIGEGQGVKPTSAKKVHTGTVHFYRKSVSVTAGEMENTLKRELAELSDNSVVDLLLSGAVSEEEYEQLEAYHSSLEIDPAEDVARKEQEFEEQKELISHWLHIKEVFLQKKQALSGNPMQDISDRFTHYLRMITDDKISSEFPDTNKLNMQIYSDDRLVDYGKLSEGTKETVFLAFRLAVLDHLFPDGGGVIVLDDPFTDMDDTRTAQSCKLVQDCAKRHQVIFLTCKEEYPEMLNGKVIRMEP